MTTPTLKSAVDQACAMLRGGGWNGEADRLRAAVEAAPILALPEVADGHWSTPEGREMATEYATKARRELCMGDKPDLAIANAVYLVDRYSLELIHFQTAAKERIRWLSVQLHLASERARRAEAALRQARDLIGLIEQRSADNCWWVNSDDPEVAVCDTWMAVIAVVGEQADAEPDADAERCMACNIEFKPGDPYYLDASGSCIHADCCGPERESYTGADGEPLKDGEPVPTPRVWEVGQ